MTEVRSPRDPAIPSPLRMALEERPCGAAFGWVEHRSAVLGIDKTFGLYLPPGYAECRERYPVLYLLRGQEDEWAGEQDGREGLLAILDRMIVLREIGPLIVVLPGFMPPSQKSQGVPVNWSGRPDGWDVGTGRFEDYFFELKALIETEFRARRGKRSAAVDGFSMGGWSALFLATRYPNLFGSVGAFDGSFMWRHQIDPRRSGRERWDRLWFGEPCAPFFRRKRRWNVEKMERHNPVWHLERAGSMRLLQLRRTAFHVRSVPSETHGNIDRARHVVSALARRGIDNSFDSDEIVLDAGARHTWKWADIHLAGTLPLHDAVFRSSD